MRIRSHIEQLLHEVRRVGFHFGALAVRKRHAQEDGVHVILRLGAVPRYVHAGQLTDVAQRQIDGVSVKQRINGLALLVFEGLLFAVHEHLHALIERSRAGRTDIFYSFLVVRVIIRTRIGLFRSTRQEYRARCTVPRDIFAHPAANRAQRHVGRAVVAQRRVNRLAVLAREGSRNALCIDVRALRIDFYGGAGLRRFLRCSLHPRLGNHGGLHICCACAHHQCGRHQAARECAAYDFLELSHNCPST